MRAIPWAIGCYAVGILAARIVNGSEWFREEGTAVLLWPVIVNRRDEVILIPGLGCDTGHYSICPGFSVIQLSRCK